MFVDHANIIEKYKHDGFEFAERVQECRLICVAMKFISKLVVFVAFFASSCAIAQPGPTRTASPIPDYSDDQANPAMQPILDDPKLPRVLLIGDSISIGYTLPVRKLLAGIVNVHRIPMNGGSTTDGLTHLSDWLGTNHWDVIHFNWGLHDLKLINNGQHQVELPQYEENLRRLVTRLKATGAKLIWASTTPVPEGKLDPPRNPKDVPRYNEAALRVMKESDIFVNDLYAFALPRLYDIQLPANVHFTPAGWTQLAQRVADSILTALSVSKKYGRGRKEFGCRSNGVAHRAVAAEASRPMVELFPAQRIQPESSWLWR